MQFEKWSEYVANNPMLKAGVELLNKIKEIGGEDSTSYIVGGTVRDLIIGNKEPDDIDISTSVPIDILEPHFDTHDIGANKDFGILVVCYNDFMFEVANYRQDGEYSDGRRPDSVEIVNDFMQDALRRDFTINAMGVDGDGNVVDYFGGIEDIYDKKLRTVGDPEKRFSEDYLRMLRAVRFASRLDFSTDRKTFIAIQNNAEKIADISKERVMKELGKMAEQSGEKFADSIERLNDCGLLEYVLPEIKYMQMHEHSEEFHPEGNVYKHTLAALRCNEVADKVINLSILWHDIGKVITHSVGNDGVHHYYKHNVYGLDSINDVCERLKIDNRTKETLKFVCLNHMTLHDFLNVSKSKAMKLINHEDWNVLLQASYCDSKCRGEIFDTEEWLSIVDRVESLKEWFSEKQSIDAIRKVINGNFVMSLRSDISPSPEMGRIIKDTVDWIVDNSININDIDKIKEYIKRC